MDGTWRLVAVTHGNRVLTSVTDKRLSEQVSYLCLAFPVSRCLAYWGESAKGRDGKRK